MVMVHAFNPSPQEAETGKFVSESSLVYRASSCTARVQPCVQRNPALKNQK